MLFTDGVPEASSPGGEFFGEARFEALLAEGKDDDAAAVARRVVERVEAFQEGTRYDDLTLVVLRRR